MYTFMSPSKAHTTNHFLQDCHSLARAFDAAADASLLLMVLRLELLLTDLSLVAVLPLAMLVADLQAKLPEDGMEGASAGTFA